MARKIKPVDGAHKALSVRVNKSIWTKIFRHVRRETRERGYEYRVSHFINDLLTDYFKN